MLLILLNATVTTESARESLRFWGTFIFLLGVNVSFTYQSSVILGIPSKCLPLVK